MKEEDLQKLALSMLDMQRENMANGHKSTTRPKKFALEEFLKNCPKKMRAWRGIPPH
ncbi:hypothetical protein NGB58_23805 [Escherichia coli]|nr:hypothetical protein [Escherichia coli]